MAHCARMSVLLALIFSISLPMVFKSEIPQDLAILEYTNSENDVVLTQLDTCYKAHSHVSCSFIKLKYGYSLFYYKDNDHCQTNANHSNYQEKRHTNKAYSLFSAKINIPCKDLYTSIGGGPGLVGSAIATSVMASASFGMNDINDTQISVAGAGVCREFSSNNDQVHWVSLKRGYNMQMYKSTSCTDDSFLFTFDEGYIQKEYTNQPQLKNETNLVDPVSNDMYINGTLTDKVRKLFNKIKSINGIRGSKASSGTNVPNTTAGTAPMTTEEPKTPNGLFYFYIVAMVIFLIALFLLGILAHKRRQKISTLINGEEAAALDSEEDDSVSSRKSKRRRLKYSRLYDNRRKTENASQKKTPNLYSVKEIMNEETGSSSRKDNPDSLKTNESEGSSDNDQDF